MPNVRMIPRVLVVVLVLLATRAAWTPGVGAEPGPPGLSTVAIRREEPPGTQARSPRRPFRGEMTYMADAARFTDCLTGRSYPIAMEKDFPKMEEGYRRAAKEPGAKLYVTFEGTIAERPKMEGDGSESTVVVDAFLEAWPGKTCDSDPAARPQPVPASPETRQVHFAKGTSSAAIKGSVKGDQIIDYRLGARAGQTMTVALKTDNTANFFNVLPPGSDDVAVFVGSTGGSNWGGKLDAGGEYTIRVYLMRNAARRRETAHFTLTVGIEGNASSVGLGRAPAGDARVAGTRYHATGAIPCSMGDAAPGSSQCEFGVIRGRPGNAEVHITPPGGFERVLTFTGGKVSASGGASVKAARKGDDWLVDVNDYEHYRIPEAVILGG